MSESADLSHLFLSHIRHAALRGLIERGADPAALERLLGEAWEQGREAWPGLALPAPLFIQHIAERLGEPADWPAFEQSLRGLCITDLYLACACLNEVGDALRRFDKAIIQRVPAFVSNLRLPPSFVEDVQQEVRRKLLVGEGERQPGLSAYAGRGELANWVRAAAVRAAISMRRNKNEQNERDDGSMAERMAGVSADPVVESMKRKYGAEFKAALEQSIGALSSEHRSLLRLYYVDGVTTGQLGAMFSINQSSISRRLIGIREELLRETKRRLRDSLRLSESALDELSALVQSQLDLSLSRILK